jgi:hypothetical protein
MARCPGQRCGAELLSVKLKCSVHRVITLKWGGAMSRGHGRIERALLEAFTHWDAVDAFRLAGYAYHIQPDSDGVRLIDEAQLVTTRRALAKLAKEGLVFEGGRRKGAGRRIWYSQREWLYRALLEKSIQISNTAHRFGFGRPYTPDEIKEFKKKKMELIALAKSAGAWSYILAKWRKRD